MTKLDYALMPEEFNDVILVLMNGAKKYEAHGWEKGIKFEKEANVASIKRHLSDFRLGKMTDDESGLHPLLHVACRALMQYTLNQRAAVAVTKMQEFDKERAIQEQHLECNRPSSAPGIPDPHCGWLKQDQRHPKYGKL